MMGLGQYLLAAGPPPDLGDDLGSLLKLGFILLVTIGGAVLAKRQEQKARRSPPPRPAQPKSPTQTRQPAADTRGIPTGEGVLRRPWEAKGDAPTSAGPPIAQPIARYRPAAAARVMREDADRALELLRRRAQQREEPPPMPAPTVGTTARAIPPRLATTPRVPDVETARRITELLAKPTDLRAAIVLAEILAPPVALREG
jgi:hypothetical protein